jgi:hypothetical protein
MSKLTPQQSSPATGIIISSRAPAMIFRSKGREGAGAAEPADYARRGLIFQVAASMPAVISPQTNAASGITSASAAVAAHPIEEKASTNVASRDDVCRRRK